MKIWIIIQWLLFITCNLYGYREVDNVVVQVYILCKSLLSLLIMKWLILRGMSERECVLLLFQNKYMFATRSRKRASAFLGLAERVQASPRARCGEEKAAEKKRAQK